jgi:5'-nucleotidase
VAAATEGFLLGIPSIAISLTSFDGNNYATAGQVARELVERYIRDPIREPVLLNVNVPDIPYAELKGMEITRLGRRHKAEPVVKMMSPRNETVYWVGAAGAAADAGPGTDFNAIERGAVSITPLQIDLTHSAQLPSIRQWML